MPDNSWRPVSDKNISAPCSEKNFYIEGSLEFWCCPPHCKEAVDDFNEKKSKKISKKDQ